MSVHTVGLLIGGDYKLRDLVVVAFKTRELAETFVASCEGQDCTVGHIDVHAEPVSEPTTFMELFYPEGDGDAEA